MRALRLLQKARLVREAVAALEALYMCPNLDTNTIKPVENAYGKVFQQAATKDQELRDDSMEGQGKRCPFLTLTMCDSLALRWWRCLSTFAVASVCRTLYLATMKSNGSSKRHFPTSGTLRFCGERMVRLRNLLNVYLIFCCCSVAVFVYTGIFAIAFYYAEEDQVRAIGTACLRRHH